MPAITLSRPGQINGAGDDLAMFLTVFGGEVLAQFLKRNKFLALTRVKEITSGKSAKFPAVGTAGVKYHVPGENILTEAGYLQQIKNAEREIWVDDVLTSSTVVDKLDTMRNHWDERSEYARQLSAALANEADTHVLSTIFAAAKAAATVDTGFGGGNVTIDVTTPTNPEWRNDAAFTAAVFRDAIIDAARILDEKDVPQEDRYVALRYPEYYKLLKDPDKLLDRDFSSGNGDYAQGRLARIGGMLLVPTTNMPETNLELINDPGVRNDPHGAGGIGYNTNWEPNIALVFQREAVGTVRMSSLAVEMEYRMEYQGWFTLAKYVMGHNILRPECAVRITAV